MPPRWSEQYDAVVARFAPLKADFSFATDAGEYRIAATLTDAKSGLLSRYKIRPNQRVTQGLAPELEQDCGC